MNDNVETECDVKRVDDSKSPDVEPQFQQRKFHQLIDGYHRFFETKLRDIALRSSDVEHCDKNGST